MPRTVDEGFRDFLPKLTPSASETQAAKNHRASIKARLEVDYDLVRFFRTGSFGNGTSISGYSDVDYLASLAPSKLHKNSGTSLRAVRSSLDDRFPNTGVAVDCPAVVVPFGARAKESTEVVPAYYIESSGGHSVYGIPDCTGGWVKASPEAHTAYVRHVDQKHAGKVKSLIRFLKAWKFFRNVPVSSFYLELRVAKYADGESTIDYAIDVSCILDNLNSIGLAKMLDPLGVSGYIAPCKTAAQLTDAKSKLSTAATRAGKARAAQLDERISDAFDWWRLVFGEKFPTYYR